MLYYTITLLNVSLNHFILYNVAYLFHSHNISEPKTDDIDGCFCLDFFMLQYCALLYV